uniref:Uncharacterized protein n=1 Tax=Octactis speculum TaxID=3111310 RepID=A0A6U3W0B0_9STRA|mmetsp:Transcript_48559/g.66109  ORF Transcript_48559/g.66109 Transcript_48559/m.66109 type:complete len:474 (+) Transcript_48559:60-1481(+)
MGPRPKIIVIGFPVGTDSEKLQDMCEEFGKIYSCTVVGFDPATGNSRGYGFVTFAEEDSCTAAIAKLHKSTVEGGRVLNVRLVEDDTGGGKKGVKGNSKDANKIIVAGITSSTDDEKLKIMCEEFGLVLRAQVVRNAVGKSKGFGFVTFTNKSAQRTAVLKLNKRMLGGGRILNVRALDDKKPQTGEEDLNKDAADKGQKASAVGGGGGSPESKEGKEASDGKSKSVKEGGKGVFPPGVCISYQSGKCHRGRGCKWRHEKVVGVALPAKKRKAVQSESGAAGPQRPTRGVDTNDEGDDQITFVPREDDMGGSRDHGEIEIAPPISHRDPEESGSERKRKKGGKASGGSKKRRGESDGVVGSTERTKAKLTEEESNDDISVALQNEADSSLAILSGLGIPGVMGGGGAAGHPSLPRKAPSSPLQEPKRKTGKKKAEARQSQKRDQDLQSKTQSKENSRDVGDCGGVFIVQRWTG